VQQVAGAAGIALLITVMAAAEAGAAGPGTTAAGAAGARAAFLVAAIIASPLIIGAFLIRKPADSPEGIPAGH
jgi:DHA2 family lincomycin resistance protein-like MFS transporter